MARIGRNDPCPCGSEVKYKKCCLPEEEARASRRRESRKDLRVDMTTEAFRAVIGEAGPATFIAATAQTALTLRRALCREIGDGLDGKAAADALEAHLAAIEGEMARVISKHGLLYWLHTTRRLPPFPVESASRWTVLLYRRILGLALVKYADWEEVSDINAAGDLLPAELSRDDILDAFSLERLAHEFHMTTADYRKVGKGAVLRVRGDTPIAEMDELTEDMVQLIDQRVSDHGDLTTFYGALVSTDIPETPGEDGRRFRCLGMTVGDPDVDKEEVGSALGIWLTGPPNYLIHDFSLDGIRGAAAPFDDEVRTLRGVGIDDLLGAIWGLSIFGARALRDSPRFALQMSNTAYFPVQDDHYDRLVSDVAGFQRAFVVKHGGNELPMDQALVAAREALDSLTWHHDDRESISLWERLPFRVLLPVAGFTLIDFTAFHLVVSDLFREIGFLDGEAGNVKARGFEDELIRLAESRGLSVWERQKVLKAGDGSQREIDVGIVAGDTLYITEAKAFSQSPRLDRGDYSAMTGRWQTLTKYLEQARTLKEFLESNPQGRNYEVPADVTQIEHFVVCPAPEYIPDRAHEYWYDDDTPRICVPEELLSMIERQAD